LQVVRVIKKWDSPDLLRQTMKNDGVWGDLRFTLDPVERCDYCIVCNYVHEEIVIECPPENVFLLIQEPYVKGIFDWVVRGHSQFARVFTHHPLKHSRYVAAPPLVPWHVERDWRQLTGMDLPQKRKDLSLIASNKTNFPGHKKRLDFLNYIRENVPEADVFGKGINFIEDKWDGLGDYRYSISIENSSTDDYWTEKIADCFLGYTLPFYYGCTNIESYFPEESFIRIDIDDPSGAIETIMRSIRNNEWKKRLPAIVEARKAAIDRLQFFPYFHDYIKTHPGKPEGHRTIVLKENRKTSRPPYPVRQAERIINWIKKKLYSR
jgi:hypothetical protein